ncbi:MAG: mercuric ion binding protein [Salibacteraceae bacterium]|jgi:copper chaperone CopZ
MKNLGLLIAFVAISLFSTAAFAKGGTKTIKIQTSSQCEMCKTTIEKGMAFVKGVKKTSLDVESSILTVEYNPAKTNPDEIKRAVAAIGYDADEVVAEQKAYDNLDKCCKKGAHK